jgi:3-methyladenine DNA glycosylase/8-oxoguanine DNA glycosylase
MDRKEFDRIRSKYTPYGSVASLYIWELAHRPELLALPSRKTV